MRTFFFLICAMFVALVGLSGCGANSLATDGQITGNVFDTSGAPVRNARVWINGGPESRTTSSGNFLLTNVGFKQVILRCEVTSNGVDYYGETTVLLFDGERTKNANITMIQRNQIAKLRGRIYNLNGDPVSGVRIFANDGGSSSIYGVTDANGDYLLGALRPNITYSVLASARGFNSDFDNVTINAGDTEFLDLVLRNPSDTAFTPPTGVSTIAWTTPAYTILTGTGNNPKMAFENVKRLFDKNRVTRLAKRGITAKNTPFGNPIEVEIDWDPVDSLSLLGWGIYRRTGTVGNLNPVEFLRDPFGYVFYDNDENLLAGASYGYGVTKLNVLYPDTSNSESGISTIVQANTLSDLTLGEVDTSTNPVQFFWNGGSGATSYVVYVFNRYPNLNVPSIWNNEGSPAVGNSVSYGGGALTPGETYYYLVLGLANGNQSRTISPVGSFVAP